MLVYDITNEKSFENIRNWVRNIEEVISLFLLNTRGAVSASPNLIALEVPGFP